MKKTKITIGIPAHNEEKNIKFLIGSILSQKFTSDFTLDKIIIACDGCTDKTAEIVRNLQKKHKNVFLINDGKRLGKAVRLNNFYKDCKSDLFITFDADVVLFNDQVLIELVKQFKDQNVGLVGGIDTPSRGETIVQKAQFAYDTFWNDLVLKINNGNNVHRHQGRISAGRVSVLKKIIIPQNIAADDHFLYFAVKKNGYKFQCSKKALVVYKNPKTLSDYVLQMTRFIVSKNNIDDYFGDTSDEYFIPRKLKLSMYIKHILQNPFYMIVALFMNIYQRCFQFGYKKNVTAAWEVVKTSK